MSDEIISEIISSSIYITDVLVIQLLILFFRSHSLFYSHVTVVTVILDMVVVIALSGLADYLI